MTNHTGWQVLHGRVVLVYLVACKVALLHSTKYICQTELSFKKLVSGFQGLFIFYIQTVIVPLIWLINQTDWLIRYPGLILHLDKGNIWRNWRMSPRHLFRDQCGEGEGGIGKPTCELTMDIRMQHFFFIRAQTLKIRI